MSTDLIDQHSQIHETAQIGKNVTANEPFFMGHFPGQPIMPGVLIIEALAQVAGVLGFKSQEKKPKDGYLYYFVGADEVRLRIPVVPGDQLILKANVITNRRGIYKFSAEALVGEELVGKMNIPVSYTHLTLPTKRIV